MTTPSWMPPLPETFIRLYGQEERIAWARQMHAYAEQYRKAWVASLKPAAWIGGPHGAIRADPEYRLKGPQTLHWKLPLYLLDDQP